MGTCTDHQACVDEALAAADQICREKGLRFTELRRKLFKMIWASHTPSKAYDLLDALKQDSIAAKPPTVYRTLDFLMEHGLIHKLNSLNAYVGCAHPLTHHECYFLICKHCKTITECCNHALEQAISSTVDKNKFRLKQVTLEIEGECAECAR